MVFLYILIFHISPISFSVISALLVGLLCFDDYWFNIEKLAAFLCFTPANLFHLNPLNVRPMDKIMKWVLHIC